MSEQRKGFTEDQVDHLGNTLDPSVVKPPAPGKYGDYIEAWYCIAEANRIFGFDGWDRETVEMRLVCEHEAEVGRNKDKGWAVSYVSKVRVTVRAGSVLVTKEGTGAGHGTFKSLGEAHESAVKEAESDAMKRALMQFGNPFGLALYDKSKANVAVPRESKANSRGLYEALQSGLRSQASVDDLKRWGRDNAADIRTLPEDWADNIRDEFAQELEAHKAAATGNAEMDAQFAATVAE